MVSTVMLVLLLAIPSIVLWVVQKVTPVAHSLAPMK